MIDANEQVKQVQSEIVNIQEAKLIAEQTRVSLRAKLAEAQEETRRQKKEDIPR